MTEKKPCSLLIGRWSPSRNNEKIILVKFVPRWTRSWGTPLCRCLFFRVPLFFVKKTAGTILTGLLSERGAIGRVALRSHPGAELGTDKKENPVNLCDTLACVWTKRILRHGHNWRDHAVPAFFFSSSLAVSKSSQLCGLTIPQRNDRKRGKGKSQSRWAARTIN